MSTVIIMKIMMMMMTIFCRPASYGSWQAQSASKVEGPSKEPGPFLYSGMILFTVMMMMMMMKRSDDYDDNDDK